MNHIIRDMENFRAYNITLLGDIEKLQKEVDNSALYLRLTKNQNQEKK